MQYFTHLINSNQAKNQLQKDVLEVVEALEGLIVNDKDAFLARLRETVEELNTQYSRCIPLIPHIWETYNGGVAVGFGDSWTCNLYLFKVRGTDKGGGGL